MRIPIPERFPAKHIILFAVSLFLVEILEGTDLTFALLVMLYVLLFGTAFNVAGGITYPSGAWIFFTGTLTCLVGIVYKAFLGQPAESHLKTPLITMGAYCVGMGGMALAAYVCTFMRPKRALLQGIANEQRYKQAAIGCLILGVTGSFLTLSANVESANFVTAFAQLNHFIQMAVILGTNYQILKSSGKSSTNWVVWAGGGFMFAIGIIAYSKEGMFAAFVSWLVPCIALRFSFSNRQVVGGILAMAFVIYYLVPYSQIGRQSRGEGLSFATQLTLAEQYLFHLNETREAYEETSGEISDVSGELHLFDKSEGIFDRLQMITFDDALIDYTNNATPIGFGPTEDSFLNTIPRFIWASKPTFFAGNEYGRNIGVISQDDVTTGISFSPVGDAYHQGSWIGVGIVLPLVMLLLFLVADSLSGDVRKAPWGLLFIAISAHQAPEGLLVGAIWMTTFGAEILIFVALLSSYVLPRLVVLFSGGERIMVRRNRDFKFGARKLPIIQGTEPGSST
jgi:hypothetical protein